MKENLNQIQKLNFTINYTTDPTKDCVVKLQEDRSEVYKNENLVQEISSKHKEIINIIPEASKEDVIHYISKMLEFYLIESKQENN